jgi:asparagine synthase (glutamine-hydrolysing)
MACGAGAIGFVVRVRASSPGNQGNLEVYGPAQDHELSRHEYHGAVLLVFGHCLLGSAARSAGFAAAVDSADLDRVADWPGSYTAVVLRSGTVTAFTDLAGQFPLYYSQLNGELIVGSDPGHLASCHRRGLDLVTAAAHIACPAVLPVWSERSPYSGVRRLPGGAALRADTGGVRIGAAKLPLPVEGITFSDAVDTMRAALTGAVRARCEGQIVSSDFSGGLDSAAIAFLAARHSPRPVTSVAYHQPLAPAGDLADAVRFAGLDPRIKLAVVRGSERTLPFAGLAEALREDKPLADAMPWSPEPAQGTLAADRSALRLAAASSSGAGLHLTGEGGDALLLAAPSYLSSLSRLRTARTLFQHCGAYARLRYASPVKLAVRSLRLARTSPSRAIQKLAAEVEHGAGQPAEWGDVISWWPPCGEAAAWLTPSIRRQLAEIIGDPATARAVPEGAGPADLAALTDLRRSGEAQRHLRELARPFGIAVHAPFLDSAVIRAALSVPAVSRADPWSYKPLLRAAMAELVPGEVLDRRTKGDYSAEAYRGARGASDALRDLLRDSRLAALGVLEPGVVCQVVDRMSAGVAVPLGPLHMVLAIEVWLRIEDDVKTGALVEC